MILGTASLTKTTFNVLNIMLGMAILSTPYTVMLGGWLSMTFLLVLGATTLYTGLLIRKCMDSDPNILTYPDIGHGAFGRKGRVAILICMNLELFLVATGYIILAGDNLHNLFPNFKIKISGIITIGGQKSFILLTSLVLAPTVYIDNIAIISYLSASGVVSAIFICGLILWSCLFDGIGLHQRGELIHWKGLATSLGLYVVCFSGHPIFPTLYTSMKNRRHFPLVLFICFLVCALIYGGIAVIGYSMFGSKLQSQITLNLPKGKLSSKLATLIALFNSLSKYGLVLKPIFDMIESRYKSLGRRRYNTLIMRSILVGSTMIVALIMPFYGYLMSFVGAFMIVIVSILLPCVCYLKISGIYRKLCLETVIIVLTALMGLIFLVVGTYASLAEIIKHMLHHT